MWLAWAMVKTSNKQVKGWIGDWVAREVVEQSWPSASLEGRVVAGKAFNALLECLLSGGINNPCKGKSWPTSLGK